MTERFDRCPFIDFRSEETQAQRAFIERTLRQLTEPLPNAPVKALQLLIETACADTGGSQAARNFLFWLVGAEDPTGFQGNGGLELRRLDAERKAAAFEILRWWAGPTQSDEPLYDALRKLRARFPSESP